MAIYMGTYSDTDRMIILSKLEEFDVANQLNPSSPPSPPLTTVFYLDDQISAYHNMLASTTPLSAKKRIPIDKSANSGAAMNSHPSNHKHGYRKHNFVTDINALTVKPSVRTETKHIEFPQNRVFLHTLDDYDNDFIDVSYPKANNIQDIINQSTGDDDEIESVGGNIVGGISGGVGEMINDLILPSMPFSRPMKVEGIYRREKTKRDQLSTMETAVEPAHVSAPTHAQNKNAQHKFGQFLKFKPPSPSDVNLLAASNMMKFKAYTHNKPRPLTTPAMSISKFSNGDYYGSSSDPNVIYHQVISANRNGRFEKPPVAINNKPFSLMLDVYPMPEDGLSPQQLMRVTSTRMPPFGGVPNRRPVYPVMNSHAINNNLQYNKDSTMHSPFQYPQLQPYPYNRSPYALNPIAKEGYMRNYAVQRMNVRGLSSRRSVTAGDETPSQLTVHLNLYPDRKKTRNMEIVNREELSDHDLPATTATISSAASDHAHTLWKRLEWPMNSTITKMIDSMRSGRFPLIKPLSIPPFSAIKSDLFHELDDMTESPPTPLSNVEQLTTDTAVDYDTTTFDSKKLKLSPLERRLANAITSSTTPMSIPMESLASTIPSATTMSSLTSASPLFFTTPINQIPSASTEKPTQYQTTPSIISTATNDPNESKLDQPTTTTDGTSSTL